MKKNSYIKDALILFLITLISGISLGFVYQITKEPIEKASMAAKAEAYKEVFADAKEFKNNEEENAMIEAVNEELKSKDFGNVKVNEIVAALDESGNVIGYVISSVSADGYGGDVSISVGISKENIINGIAFLSISETPGLGMRAKEEEFYSQFTGKKGAALSVTKSGAPGEAEINAISGATITSRAVTNAVNAAEYFVAEKLTK